MCAIKWSKQYEWKNKTTKQWWMRTHDTQQIGSVHHIRCRKRVHCRRLTVHCSFQQHTSTNNPKKLFETPNWMHYICTAILKQWTKQSWKLNCFMFINIIYKGVNTKVNLKSGMTDKGIYWTVIQRNVIQTKLMRSRKWSEIYKPN